MHVRAFISHPVFIFFAVGAVLFALSRAQEPGETAEGQTIRISAAEQENLATLFERTWRRPPTDQEMVGLLDARIEEELLYREALALGLDADDVIVRRRMAQKMEFILDDLSGGRAPSEYELAAFFAENAGDYTRPAIISFRQVFLSGERHGAGLEDKAYATLEGLIAGIPPDELGDSSLLPQSMEATPLPAVARAYGEVFAQQLVRATPGEWAGPVLSPFGMHVVFVSEFQPDRPETLTEAKAAVARDWQESERTKAREAYVKALREKYTIETATPAEDTSG